MSSVVRILLLWLSFSADSLGVGAFKDLKLKYGFKLLRVVLSLVVLENYFLKKFGGASLKGILRSNFFLLTGYF